MRKLVLAVFAFTIALIANAAPARADFALGFFLGDPTGLDLKLGLSERSGLDVVLGINQLDAPRVDYGHLTYLVTPLVAQANSIVVPVRFGIGGAVFGDSGHVDVGLRVPAEVALRLRTTPLEFYGEIALLFVFNNADLNLQGGGGIRFYF